MVRDKLNKRELEEQRKQAVEVLERGYEPTEVADIFDVDASSVRGWKSIYEKEGIQGLEAVSQGTQITDDDTLPERSQKELVFRRKEAVRCVKRGFTAEEVSYIFDVGKSSVRRWRRVYDEEGMSGLDMSRKSYYDNIDEPLENVSSEYIREVLTKVEGSKPTQRVMIALNYKEFKNATQKELSEIYNLSPSTIRNCLTRIRKSKNESIEQAIYNSEPNSKGTDEALSEEELSELENSLNKGAEEYDLGDDYWTGDKVVKIIERLFDKSVSVSTARRYLRRYRFRKDKINIQDLSGLEIYNSRQRSIRCIDSSELREKLSQVADKPTQRLMTAILYKQGFTATIISDWFDISNDTLYRWFGKIESKPLGEAIYDNEREGRDRKLGEKQLQELEKELEKGAEEHGFTGQFWTGIRVSRLIQKEFDESVSDATARNYLKSIGWSWKKPVRRPIEYNEEDINEFCNENWIRIRNEAKTENQAIVFIDETKFRLLPTFKSTWAPKGERAVVKTSGLFNYIAVIGALIYVPETQKLNLRWKKQRFNFDTQSVLSFLRYIAQELSREPIFLLDNWSPHKSATKEFESNSNKVLNDFSVEWFPEYASGLNPVDKVWGQAKYNELANYAPKNLNELEEKVDETLTDIQVDDTVLRYCIKDTGLEIEA
jgi:transposase